MEMLECFFRGFDFVMHALAVIVMLASIYILKKKQKHIRRMNNET